MAWGRRNAPGKHRENTGKTLGKHWENTGKTLGKVLGKVQGKVLGKHQKSTGKALEKHWKNAGKTLEKRWNRPPCLRWAGSAEQGDGCT